MPGRGRIAVVVEQTCISVLVEYDGWVSDMLYLGADDERVRALGRCSDTPTAYATTQGGLAVTAPRPPPHALDKRRLRL